MLVLPPLPKKGQIELKTGGIMEFDTEDLLTLIQAGCLEITEDFSNGMKIKVTEAGYDCFKGIG